MGDQTQLNHNRPQPRFVGNNTHKAVRHDWRGTTKTTKGGSKPGPGMAGNSWWWNLVALTLRQVVPDLERNSGNIVLNVALRFPRLFLIRGRG